MIPTIIREEHILKAAQWIDEHGDSGRPSRRYLVVINGKPYPPKLIISKAYFYAHGSDWPHSNFHGGEETNSFLRRLGFDITEIASTASERQGLRERSESTRPKPYSAPVLDRVRCIARDLEARVTSVESDSEGRDARSLLIIHMADGDTKDIRVLSESDGEDDILYASLSMEFNPPVSGYTSDRPEEEYSEFLSPLMRGRTLFKVELEGRLLKGLELRQIIPVPAGDDTLRIMLMAALLEIIESEKCVRAATSNLRAPSRDSIGRDKTPVVRDNMFA